MLPSRRLGRLAQLLVLSQRPRRFLSTERVARHVAKPPLGASRAATRVESAAEALSLYQACGAACVIAKPPLGVSRAAARRRVSGRGASSLPSVWCGMGVSLSSYSRWHRVGRQPRRCFIPPPPATPRVPSRAVFPLLISSLTQPVRAATHRRGERGHPTTLCSECLGGSWHGPPSCLMPLPSPPRSLAISIDHAVTLSSLFFPDHPHLATRSTTSSAVYQSMQVRGSAIQRAADAAMGVRRWESRRCRHSD